MTKYWRKNSMAAMTKKVLLIGWDAADWKVINPLLDAGKMPALARIVNNGVIGNIMTLDPPLSPMLWTSIATGKRADKHGIIGFMEPDVKNSGVRPINVTSRKTRALWNILTGVGKKSNVISWWPSHPAEPINGAMVSNFFQLYNNKKDIKKWQMPKGCIHPKELVPELIKMRIHPFELTPAHIIPFIPKYKDLDEKHKNFILSFIKILGENSSVHAAATWLMENKEWDLTAVYFDGIDHASHGFMKFYPPQIPGIPDDLYQILNGVVSGMYIYHDMMLERLIQLAGKDTTVIILSDHGFHSDHLRKTDLPKYAAAPALDHRQFGILCMAGNNIQKDERIYGATLLDIAPTVLTMLGLPVGKDMDGKVLANAFVNPVVPEYIESWDKVEGDFGEHPADLKEDSIASAEAMKQLIDLGYVEDFGEDKAKAMEKTVIESKYNLARVFLSKNDFPSAISLLEELVTTNEKDARFLLALSKSYLSQRKYEKAQDLINKLREIDDKHIPNVDVLEAILNSQQGKNKKALALLHKAEESGKISALLYTEMGKVFLTIRRPREAAEYFSRTLQIDSGNPYAFYGLGCAQLRVKSFEAALDSLLNSIELAYHFHPAHIKLGETLYHLRRYEEACQAFEVSLTMAPRMIKPRQWLQKIYTENLDELTKAEVHASYLKKLMKGNMYIVSGLPRSGTSMMMQMLEAGGIEIFTDSVRTPDENNPKGYLEHNIVKTIKNNKTWLPQAEGKAVKIIAQLLQYLPAGYKYKIIFMLRDMNEVLTSQQKMLGKNQDVLPLHLAGAFQKTLDQVKTWSSQQVNVDLLYLNYSDVIDNPDEAAENINTFLKMQLDTENMASSILPELYRNKNKAEEEKNN
jgi:predicted AlkP superfamily phosphohydrolase/phosphomutase/tetratricopeptide (TPR) repeat protein